MMVPIEENQCYKLGQYLNGSDDEVQFVQLRLQGVIGKLNLNPLADR